MGRMYEKSNNKLNTIDKVIKTLYFLAYILWNIFLLVMIIRSGMDAGDGGIEGGGAESNIGYVFTFLILGVVYGGIGNIVISVLALIGLICAACNRSNPYRKKAILTYIVLILLPIITEVLIVLGGLYIPELIL